MSGRCKACNAFMSDEDMTRKLPPDNTGKRRYSELCGDCHEKVLMDIYGALEDTDYEPLYTPHRMSRMQEDWS